MSHLLKKILSAFCLKKQPVPGFYSSDLDRTLSTFDLTFLALGNMIGAGIWMFTSRDVRCVIGSDYFLAYLAGGLIAMLSAICYGDFAALVPRAGGAYTSTYLCAGELWAFLVGFDIVFSCIVSCALVAIAFAEFAFALIAGDFMCSFDAELQSLSPSGDFARCWRNSSSLATSRCVTAAGDFVTLACNGSLHVQQTQNAVEFQENYVALVVVILAVLVANCGVRIYSNINSVLVSLGLTCAFVLCTLGFYEGGKLNNWHVTALHEFLPNGDRSTSLLKALASSYFAYLGFDVISMAAEETRNPSTSIPIATLVSMVITVTLYCCFSAAINLLVPYYAVSHEAPFYCALRYLSQQYQWSRYVFIVGAACAMYTSVSGLVYRASRVIYAMSSDRLLFGVLCKVSKRTKVPFVALGVFGTIMALVAMLIPSRFLNEMASVSGLLSVTALSCSVLVLHHQKYCQQYLSNLIKDSRHLLSPRDLHPGQVVLPQTIPRKTFWDRFRSFRTLVFSLPASIVASLAVGVLLNATSDNLNPFAIGFIALFAVIWLLCACLMLTQKPNAIGSVFSIPVVKVSLVPLVAIASIGLNILVMTQLDLKHWSKFLGWFIFAIIIYGVYSFHQSKERRRAGLPTAVVRPQYFQRWTSRTSKISNVDLCNNEQNYNENSVAQNPLYLGNNTLRHQQQQFVEPVSTGYLVPREHHEDLELLSLAQLVQLVPTDFIIYIDELNLDLEHDHLGNAGFFGYVVRAFHHGTPVAIKGAHTSSEDTSSSMLREALLMRQLKHENVRRVVGICFDERLGLLIVMEYMDTTLLSYVATEDAVLLLGDVTSFCRQICCGMAHFSAQCPPIVHRDLAARNILINIAEKHVKIADLGLARYGPSYYVLHPEVPLPRRQVAPECYERQPFSEKSDVWSMGILIWELVSRGAEPYRSLCCDNAIPDHLYSIDYRTHWPLDCPTQCPSELYSLMKCCWHRSPSSRPSFRDLEGMVEAVERILEVEHPEDLSITMGQSLEEGQHHLRKVNGHCLLRHNPNPFIDPIHRK